MKTIRAFALLWNSCALALLSALTAAPFSARAGGTIYNPTQADLEAALAGGGTATFACNGTIVLTNTITISADTILNGNGYTVTISGGNTLRIFQVAPGANFWIKSLTLSDGRVVGANGPDGAPPSPGQDAFAGAILSQGGMLTLTGCVLSNNFVQAGNGGNESTNSPPATGGAAFGGAIYVSGGNLKMTNCSIVNNTLISGRGTLGHPGIPPGDARDAAGGAIYFLNSVAVFQNVTMSGNQAIGAVGTVGYGGDPYGNFFASRGGTAAGGAVYATNSSVLVANSAFFSNSATGGGEVGGSYGFGSGAALGACLFVSSTSSATIELSALVGNVGVGGGGSRDAGAGTALGGAVCNLGSLQASDTRFSTNRCTAGGGAYVAKAGRGGGVYSEGPVIVNRCLFDGNVAVGGSDGLYGDGVGEGGGIWSSGFLSITNCTFATNLAFGGLGGSQYPSIHGAPGRGGAIMTAGGGILENLTIAGNRADSQTDGIHPPGPSQGGGLAVTNATPTLRGTIIGDTSLGGNIWGVITDGGYNISDDASAAFTAVGSLNNTDPLLDVLTDNGGPTPTMAPLPGSPAVDRIPSGYPSTDQRGLPRPHGFGADTGAFESQTLIGPPPQAPLLSISLARGGPAIYRAVITFAAQGGFSYRLLFSMNLTTWVSVATNSTPTDGQLQFEQTIQPNQAGFYRVVTP